MSVLSDKWIRKMSKEENMISPFEKNKLEEIVFLMDFLLLDMMQEFLMNLKFY
jgi:deoxycytidine triphosphate deaminase